MKLVKFAYFYNNEEQFLQIIKKNVGVKFQLARQKIYKTISKYKFRKKLKN